jgi:hypothetical protein
MEMWRPEEPWEQIEPVPATWEAEYQWTWDHCGSTVAKAPVMPFPGLSFFRVHAEGDVFHVQGTEATGFWQWNEIWLLDDAVDQVLPVVRSHEYLHAQIGGPGHPPIFDECYVMLLATAQAP